MSDGKSFLKHLHGGMVLLQDQHGHYTRAIDASGVERRFTNFHPASACDGRLCDLHGRSGDAERHQPLVWNAYGRRVMYYACDHDVLHPTSAQIGYWQSIGRQDINGLAYHPDCDGCCVDAW